MLLKNHELRSKKFFKWAILAPSHKYSKLARKEICENMQNKLLAYPNCLLPSVRYDEMVITLFHDLLF